MISSGTLMARLEFLEEWGYLTASLSFLLLGMITFIYGWYTFFISFQSGIVESALHLTNNLLFVVILLELFRTLLNFLKSHTVSLEPFLIVGIIAGIRKFLTGGAQLSTLEEIPDAIFHRHLLDMGANVTIIAVLVLAFFFYRKSLQIKEPKG
ncbi:MAG TPA: phosphate-starvation-inducible PsiE family protein [Nitrospiria bacterium]|jgi:uncharacterized membrane protein (DUF373 family)